MKLVVLIVVVLVAVLGIEVPRVSWIRRELDTRPVHKGQHLTRLLNGLPFPQGTEKPTGQQSANGMLS